MDALYADLCKKYKKSKYGCAMHCTCDYASLFKAFVATDDHSPDCKLVRPNFLYKPTGYELEWYKYPLRSAKASADPGPKEFLSMIDHCIASLLKEA